jgi:hypothetical protein
MDEHRSRTEYVESPKLKARCNLLSKLLCYILTDIMIKAPLTYSRLIKNKELYKWWTAHQIADTKEAKRLAQQSLDKKINRSLSDLEKKIRKDPNKYYTEK